MAMMARRATPIPTPAQATELSPVECCDVEFVFGATAVGPRVSVTDTDRDVVNTDTGTDSDAGLEVEAEGVVVELVGLELVVTTFSSSVMLK
jgi:hypothetical protein